jgi:hypothetical protein
LWLYSVQNKLEELLIKHQKYVGDFAAFLHYGKTAMRPIIFLDIDDVLAIDSNFSGGAVAAALATNLGEIEEGFWHHVFSSNAIENLSLLNKIFSPQYVVSSNCANYLTEFQIKYVFESASLDFVKRNLHRQWRTPKSGIGGRLIEISTWISKHLQSTPPVLIIDDYESGWNLINSVFDHNDQLVLCESKRGFEKAELEIAIQKLTKQISKK